MCVSVFTAKDEKRPTEIFDMTAVIQHPQLLNNNGICSTNNPGTRLSFYADMGFLIMISNPELCKLEPKHEHRFAQELSETVLIVKIFLDKPFKIIQDGNLHTFFFTFSILIMRLK